MTTMEKLAIKAQDDREAIEADGRCPIKESVISYEPNFTPENGELRLENSYFWDDIVRISIR